MMLNELAERHRAAFWVALAALGTCFVGFVCLAIVEPSAASIGGSVLAGLAGLALAYWGFTDGHERRRHLEALVRWPAAHVVYAPVALHPPETSSSSCHEEAAGEGGADAGGGPRGGRTYDVGP